MNNFITQSAKSYQGHKAQTALSQQFNTIGAPEEPVTASAGRRAGGQQSFRIRKFSRHGSLSRRSDSVSHNGDKLLDSAAKLTNLKKTIDSDDGDEVIVKRNNSRAPDQTTLDSLTQGD